MCVCCPSNPQTGAFAAKPFSSAHKWPPVETAGLDNGKNGEPTLQLIPRLPDPSTSSQMAPPKTASAVLKGRPAVQHVFVSRQLRRSLFSLFHRFKRKSSFSGNFGRAGLDSPHASETCLAFRWWRSGRRDSEDVYCSSRQGDQDSSGWERQ